MFYSPYNKVDSLLKYYNIKTIESSSLQQSFRMQLVNLQSNSDVQLYSDMPLYNILQFFAFPEDSPMANMYEQTMEEDSGQLYQVIKNNYSQFFFIDDIFYKSLYGLTSLRKDIYDDNINSLYYNKFNTFKYSENSYANEYFNFYTYDDVNDIITITGLKNCSVKKIYGKYFIDTDDNVRLVINPSKIIKENIKEIFYSNYSIFEFNSYKYYTISLIYSTNDDPDNLILCYNNTFLNVSMNFDSVEISLSSIFSEYISNLKEYFNDPTKLNKELFIKNTLFSIGIFLNTNDGIVRYIPYEFNKQFFNILYNTLYFKFISNFKFLCNDISVNARNDYQTSQFTPISVNNDSDSYILQSKNNYVTQTTLSNMDAFKNLLSIKSTANQYNDLLFNLNKDEIDIPIYLVNE